MRFQHLFILAPLVAAYTALAASVCNGDASLCDKLYSNVTFIGAHDSYAVGTSVADNQDKNVTLQLNDGIRALQIQTHNESDGIHVCHTSCALVDGGTLLSYLDSVASWLTANPNEVVTIVMVNIDDLPPTSFSSVFEAAGLDSKAYSPSAATLSVSSWPSLGTLIDAGTPLVVFMDTEADFTSVPYIIDEFSNMWEDAYDVTDQSYECAVNRTTGSSSSQMYMINHFLDVQYDFAGTVFWVPNKSLLNETNAESGTGSIGFHVSNCVYLYGRNPNIILLDYYDSNGNAPFDAAASYNDIADPTNTVTAGTVGSTTSATTVVSTSAISSGGNQAAIAWAQWSTALVAVVLSVVGGALTV